MPFVQISLRRGKSQDYLAGVSEAVHQALVQELGMLEGDRFQLINQHDPGEMIFNRDFRGGPRSDDFIVLRITDGIERGEEAKRRFYKTLVALLETGPGVRGEDVFVMIYLNPPGNFSFADGVPVTELVAAEAVGKRESTGAAPVYGKQQMIDAVLELFKGNDRTAIVAMLPEDFVLKVPSSLPYGGSYRGADEFDRFFKRIYDEYYTSFRTDIDRVLDAGDHLVAPISITAQGKTSDATMTVENLWLWEIEDGQFVRARMYADTAAGRNTAG
jgi:ketosteroid isomerase-like protein